MGFGRRLSIASACIATLGLRIVAAQSCSGTTTVTRAPSGCATWTGNIVIPTRARGDVLLDGLEKIEGSLEAQSASELESLSSDSLHTIVDSLSIQDIQIIGEIDFPELNTVGNLTLIGLPNMQENTLLETLTNLTSLTITNTGNTAIDGFALETLDTVYIANNNYLERINFQPYTITSGVTVFGNGQNLDLSMPNLRNAQNLSVSNCSRISTPSLEQCSTLWLNNNEMEEFNGAPLLRKVKGDLLIENNAQLNRITFPELENIGGDFTLRNNTKLEFLNELYSLDTIEGDFYMDGWIQNLAFATDNDLEVMGSFTLNIWREIPCHVFDTIYTDGVVKGNYNCTTPVDHSDGIQLKAGSTSDEAQEAMEKKNAGLGIGLGLGGLFLAFGGAVCFYLVRRRRKQREQREQRKQDRKDNVDAGVVEKIGPAPGTGGLAEKDGAEVEKTAMLDGRDVEKFEMDQPMTEMGTGAEAQELPAEHGKTELPEIPSAKGAVGIEQRHEMPAEPVLPSSGDKDKLPVDSLSGSTQMSDVSSKEAKKEK